MLRQRMIDLQLRTRNITDERVLTGMLSVPRHLFVPPHLVEQAYDDNPLSIGHGQTISQPYIVAAMAQAALLKENDKVFEVGTGCGYSAAVLSTLAKSVVTSEIINELGNSAKDRLKSLNYNNVTVLVEDGSCGFKQYAPFDAIIVTAGAPCVPSELLFQLSMGGRMIIPVRERNDATPSQHISQCREVLLRLTRINEENSAESFREEILEEVRFVPLRGKRGWS